MTSKFKACYTYYYIDEITEALINICKNKNVEYVYFKIIDDFIYLYENKKLVTSKIVEVREFEDFIYSENIFIDQDGKKNYSGEDLLILDVTLDRIKIESYPRISFELFHAYSYSTLFVASEYDLTGIFSEEHRLSKEDFEKRMVSSYKKDVTRVSDEMIQARYKDVEDMLGKYHYEEFF